MTTADDGAATLHAAVDEGDAEAVKMLLGLRYNVDPNLALTNTGVTALLMAAEADDLEMVKILLEHNADPNKVTADYGHSALYMAMLYGL